MPTAELLEEIAEPEWNSEELYEEIDGVRVKLPPMSRYAASVANRISRAITVFVTPRNLGNSEVESLFRLPTDPPRNRRPDVAFVSEARWPSDRPQSLVGTAWEIVPDLAVEVISPTDRVEELTEKLDEYFQVGVSLVWVVHPVQKRVEVYTSRFVNRFVTEAEDLEGGDVLPGFKVNVGSLFPPRT